MEKDLLGQASVDECVDEKVFGNVSTPSLTIKGEDGAEDGGNDESVNERVDDVERHHSPLAFTVTFGCLNPVTLYSKQ